MRKRNLLLIMLAAFLLATGLKLGLEWLSLDHGRIATSLFLPYLIILAYSGISLLVGREQSWPLVFQAMVAVCLVAGSIVHSTLVFSTFANIVLLAVALIAAIILLFIIDDSRLLDDPYYSPGNTVLFALGGIAFIALSCCISIEMVR